MKIQDLNEKPLIFRSDPNSKISKNCQSGSKILVFEKVKETYASDLRYRELDSAKVFGEVSYGKGSVQNIIDLSDGSGLKMTVARYLTPKGQSIEGQGIRPDVQLKATEKRDVPLEASLRWVKSQL